MIYSQLKMDLNRTIKIVCAIIDEPTIDVSAIEKMSKETEEIERRSRILSEFKRPIRPTRAKYIKIVEQHTGPKSLFELSFQVLRLVLTKKDLSKLPRDLIEKLKETIFASFPIKTQIHFFSESKVYIDDIILYHYHYNKKGELDGKCLNYISKRCVKSTNYKNGKKNGMSVVWFGTGQTCKATLYINDVIQLQKNYSYRGNLKYEAFFKNGKLEGKLQGFGKNTKLENEEFYKNGIIQYRKTYYYNGNLKSEDFFKNEKLEGKRRLYNIKGYLTQEEFYKNGKLEGECRGYNFQGSLIHKSSHSNGKKNGLSISYHPNGSTTYSYFKNGWKIKLSEPKSGLMIVLNIILISCLLLFIMIVLYNQ